MSDNSNEVRFEAVGDQKVKFENINGDWRVNTREIARVYGKKNHGQMISDMRSIHRDKWDEFISLQNILKRDLPDGRGKIYTTYLFNRKAFIYFGLSFTGKVANEYKSHFIDTFFELEKFVTRVAMGERELGPEACDMLNNISVSDNVIEIGDFAKVMMQYNQGQTIGRNKLYQLLKDMGLVSQSTNRHLNKANEYLDTKIDAKGFVYVVVRTSSMVTLIDKIFEFTSNRGDGYPEFKRRMYTGELEEYLEDDDSPIFTQDEVERTFYNKHGVYARMEDAKDDMLEMAVSYLHQTNFVGDYTIDLNGNFVDDGYKDATFNKPSITIKRDKHGNTIVWND